MELTSAPPEVGDLLDHARHVIDYHYHPATRWAAWDALARAAAIEAAHASDELAAWGPA